MLARVAATVGVALCLIAPVAWAQSQCRPANRVGSLDIKFDEAGDAYVPVLVHGKPANMLVDTGAIVSSINDSAATSIGLLPDRAPFSMTINGKTSHEVATTDVTMGTMHGDKLVLVVIPDGALPAQVDGIIAPDLLRNYDLDLDMAAAKLNLFSPDHCPGQVIYWTQAPVAVVPFTVNHYAQIHVTVEIDGKPFLAMVDTAASRSFVDYDAAEMAFGWPSDEKPTTHHFSSLSLEGVTVANPDITLWKNYRISTPGGTVEMVLGMDVLRKLHTYIAFGEGKMYLTAASAH